MTNGKSTEIAMGKIFALAVKTNVRILHFNHDGTKKLGLYAWGANGDFDPHGHRFDLAYYQAKTGHDGHYEIISNLPKTSAIAPTGLN